MGGHNRGRENGILRHALRQAEALLISLFLQVLLAVRSNFFAGQIASLLFPQSGLAMTLFILPKAKKALALGPRPLVALHVGEKPV